MKLLSFRSCSTDVTKCGRYQMDALGSFVLYTNLQSWRDADVRSEG